MIKFVHFEHEKKAHASSNPFSLENAKTVKNYHQSFPEYSVTPLTELPTLAKN